MGYPASHDERDPLHYRYYISTAPRLRKVHVGPAIGISWSKYPASAGRPHGYSGHPSLLLASPTQRREVTACLLTAASGSADTPSHFIRLDPRDLTAPGGFRQSHGAAGEKRVARPEFRSFQLHHGDTEKILDVTQRCLAEKGLQSCPSYAEELSRA
jgi:hypothetical protein